MIDEELYKLAADELNSDRRKPDIWARACALASDDHDEARYLYTNLRVEQMLEAQGPHSDTATVTAAASNSASASRLGSAASSATRASVREDVGGLSTDDKDALTLDDMRASATADKDPVSSARAGLDSAGGGNPLPIDDIIDLDDDSTASSVASSGDAISIAEDETGTFDFDLEEIRAMNAAEPDPVSPIHGASGTRNTIDDSSARRMLDRIDEFDDSVVADNNGPAASDQARQQTPEKVRTDALASELQRQMDDMPRSTGQGRGNGVRGIQTTDIDLDLDPDTPPANAPAALIAAAATGTAAVAANALPQATTDAKANIKANTGSVSGIRTDYADGNIADPVDIETELDKLQDGSGPAYMVFRRNRSVKAVKDGVSWPALFFTLPWLLFKGLIGTSIIYVLLWLAIAAGLMFSGFTWIDSGDTASTEVKLWTAAFGFLALIGLLYIPFRYGNSWVANKLMNRGFDFQALVSARSKQDAIDRLIRVSK